MIKDKYKLLIVLILILINIKIFAEGFSNPCDNPYFVSTLTNRGGISESPCAIPYDRAFLEGGYQYSQFKVPITSLQNYPQAEFRFGLPALNEIFVHLPNYNSQSFFRGSTSTGLGFKHQFSPGISHLVGSIEGVYYFPGGGNVYGNKDAGAEATTIWIYDFSPKLSSTYILKIETVSPPKIANEGRFTNLSPGFVLNYGLTNEVIIFAQTYGLTKTAPQEGGAINVVFGFFYLFNKKVALDFEYYRQLTNNLAQYKNSFGLGLSILL